MDLLHTATVTTIHKLNHFSTTFTRLEITYSINRESLFSSSARALFFPRFNMKKSKEKNKEKGKNKTTKNQNKTCREICWLIDLVRVWKVFVLVLMVGSDTRLTYYNRLSRRRVGWWAERGKMSPRSLNFLGLSKRTRRTWLPISSVFFNMFI